MTHPSTSSFASALTLPYEAYFAETLAQVNQALERYLTEPQPSSAQPAEGLWNAMRYGTLDAGKRIRPVLLIETCRACGGEISNALPTACAIELVHAQSLIHDDLPCMDNDDLRRGKPTVHRAFDEATAVLAGDALLAMAFGLITRHTPLSTQVTPQRLLEIISDFSEVASVHGLVGGQFVDIQCEGKPYTAEMLEYIHTYKTGALFRFSTTSGARLAGVSQDLVELFTTFGQKLGLAFQIVDDLLDIQSNAETLGKTVGKDQEQQKATYPALFGEAVSRQKAEALIREANQLLDSLPSTMQVEPLRTLAQFISVRIH